MEFADFGAAMKKQTGRGIHNGSHGKMVEVVCDFHVEVFEKLPPFTTDDGATP